MSGVLVALAFGGICFWRGYLCGHREGTETAKALCELALHNERQRCNEQQLHRVFGPVIARPSKAGVN